LQAEAIPTVVFEIGLNHLGKADSAKRMIDTLAANGATHITLQVIDDPQRHTRNPDRIAMLNQYYLSIEDNIAILRHAIKTGLKAGAAILNISDIGPSLDAGVSFFKVLSTDFAFEPLLAALALTGVPTYLSVGISTASDIARSLSVMRTASEGSNERLLYTVLGAPGRAEKLNLRRIATLSRTFNVPVAYGQHSDRLEALAIAIAFGAESVFVYVAQTHSPEPPDGPHAVLCSEAAAILRNIREAASMLGTPDLETSTDNPLRHTHRRSIVAAKPIRSGIVISEEDLAFKHPGTGLPSSQWMQVIGRTANRDYAVDEDLF